MGAGSSCRPGDKGDSEVDDEEFDRWANEVLQQKDDRVAARSVSRLEAIAEEGTDVGKKKQKAKTMRISDTDMPRRKTRKKRPGELQLAFADGLLPPTSPKEDMVSPVEKSICRGRRSAARKKPSFSAAVEADIRSTLHVDAQTDPAAEEMELAYMAFQQANRRTRAPVRKLTDAERSLFKAVMSEDVAAIVKLIDCEGGAALLHVRNGSGMTALEVAKDREKWRSEGVLQQLAEEAKPAPAAATAPPPTSTTAGGAMDEGELRAACA